MSNKKCSELCSFYCLALGVSHQSDFLPPTITIHFSPIKSLRPMNIFYEWAEIDLPEPEMTRLVGWILSVLRGKAARTRGRIHPANLNWQIYANSTLHVYTHISFANSKERNCMYYRQQLGLLGKFHNSWLILHIFNDFTAVHFFHGLLFLKQALTSLNLQFVKKVTMCTEWTIITSVIDYLQFSQSYAKSWQKFWWKTFALLKTKAHRNSYTRKLHICNIPRYKLAPIKQHAYLCTYA